MSIITSLFAGCPGNYNVLGFAVNFQEENLSYSFSDNLIGHAAQALLNNRMFQVLTFGYLHTFVHEMGHALAHKILSGNSSTIKICTHTGIGLSQGHGFRPNSSIVNTIYFLAGSVADITFSIALIAFAVFFKASITTPVAIGISCGAATWILGEFVYATTSLAKDDNGDFAIIARNGPAHLMAATATLIGVVALGVIGVAALI